MHYKQSPVDGLGDVCVYGHKLSFIKPEAKLATLLAYPHLHKSDTFFWVFLFKGKKEREKEKHVHSTEAFCQFLNCGKSFICCLEEALDTSPVR